MVKCEGCGVELLEGTVFCPYCGAQIKSKEATPVEIIDNANGDTYSYGEPKKENKAFKVFAVLGMVFGWINLGLLFISTVTFNTLVLPYLAVLGGLELSVPGLVFSCIGKKSTSNRGKAKFGFIVNLLSIIIFFILFIVLSILIESSGSSGLDGGYYF